MFAQNDFEIDTVLNKPLMAHLATVVKGEPRDSPVWFLWESPHIWVFGQETDSFIQRLQNEPRCALGVVDFNLERGVLRHVSVRGTSRVLSVDQKTQDITPNSDWFQALWSPSVRAGILDASDLVGYRTHPVYIRNSRHVPPRSEVVFDAMEALFDCLEEEQEPQVRAVLGHFLFVFIHPYMDGNGRWARFLMNLMLISGGYPWTVVPVARRKTYFAALESVEVDADIVPFTRLVAEAMASRE